jgi:hypothetical protein
VCGPEGLVSGPVLISVVKKYSKPPPHIRQG